MGEKENGGLKAPNICAIDLAIKMKSLLVNVNSNHPLSIIYKNKMCSSNFVFNQNTVNVSKYGFFGKITQAFNIIKNTMHKDISLMCREEVGIHKNYFAYLQNLKLCKMKCFNLHQNNMLHRLMVYGINTLKDLVDERNNKRHTNLFLDIFQIYNTIPKDWITLLSKSQRTHNEITNQLYTGLNKWTNFDKVTLKDLKNILTTNKEVLAVQEYIAKKHGTMSNTNPFLKLFKTIKDVKVRNLQFKMLHNIYPTKKHLHKWKLSDSPNCTKCNVVETLRHAIWECEIAQNAILNFKVAIESICPETAPLDISYEVIMFGTYGICRSVIGKYMIQLINTCLVLLKQKLILQRENKSYISLEEVRTLITDRIKMNSYNDRKKNR
jgi:hypothetical protein